MIQPLDALIAAARSRFPGVGVSDAQFEASLRQRLEVDEVDEHELAPHAADLLLACASAHGDASALAEVERSCIAPLEPVLARIVSAPLASEAKQRLRCALFVAEPGQPPRIASYAGRGPLRAWIRATAIRLAFKMNRERRVAEPDELLFDLPALDEDPLLGALRKRYASEIRRAFAVALSSVAPGDRVLLRQHFVDGLSTAELAAMHRVHRVTMYRWVSRVLRELLDHTRDELSRSVEMAREEIDALMRDLQSVIEVTLERVLADA